MKKSIILLVVLALSLVSVTSAFAVTGPPPPPPKGRNCVEVDAQDPAFIAMYPPPMGLYTFAACWATPAVKQVCFETPLGGVTKNYAIRYWQWDRGRWKGGYWTTYNMPTTFSNGEYCVKPVPGLQLYAIQGIQIGPGTWWNLLYPGNWWDKD